MSIIPETRCYVVRVDRGGDVYAAECDPLTWPLLQANGAFIGTTALENQGDDPERMAHAAADALRAVMPDDELDDDPEPTTDDLEA